MVKQWIEQKIEGRPNLKKIIGNTWWLFFDKMVRMGLSLVVGLWVARYLGPARFGMLNNAIAFATLFGAFATLGLESFVIQDVIKSPAKRLSILGTAFYLKLIAGSITYVFAIISIMLLKPGDEDQIDRFLVYLISAGIIFQSLDVIDYYFQSQTKSKYTVWAKTSMFLMLSGAKVVFILLNASVDLFAVVSLLELVLNGVALMYIYQRKENYLSQWKFDKSIAQSLLAQSWPFYLAYIASFIYMKIDQIMIGTMLGDKPAGLFAASTKLYEIPFFIVLIFSSSVFPSLVSFYEKDKVLFYKRYSQITGLYTLIGYGVLIFVLAFGSFLINLLFGKEYVEAFPILSIQIIGMFFLFNAGLRSSYLTITSNQKIIMITAILSAVLNVLLNFFLIPLYKTIGAAIATAVTQFFSLFLLNLLFSKTKEIFNIQLKSLLLFPILKP
ncbi:MAG: flippase [Bacteroidetes bacterium]|nr:flippase [Bacteroidota bacterium]